VCPAKGQGEEVTKAAATIGDMVRLNSSHALTAFY